VPQVLSSESINSEPEFRKTLNYMNESISSYDTLAPLQ